MTKTIVSSINVCPINFRKFDVINGRLQNIEASLIYAKLRYHQENSIIKKKGKTWIVRSRSQIASWFKFSLKKVDRLLSLLEKEKMIEKKSGLWYGKKRLYITTNSNFNQIPVNLKILKILCNKTGGIKSALIFSKIAYTFTNSKIEHETLKWCCIKKNTLAEWSGISIRTIDKILTGLSKKGLILKKNFVWNEKLQTHFHIPTFAIEVLKNRQQEYVEKNSVATYNYRKIEKDKTQLANSQPNYIMHHNLDTVNTQICWELPEKMTTSIKIRSKIKKNNNTKGDLSTDKTKTSKSNITLNKIEKNLTNRQIEYLKSAINNTVRKSKLKISNPKELWEQIKFSILNTQQRNGVKTFQHAISRCMKILADNNWRTPIGFYNHSIYGLKVKEHRQKQSEKWQKQKEADSSRAKEFFNNICQASVLYTPSGQISLTEKAINIAKRLVQILKISSTEADLTTSRLAEILGKEIERLVRQGADRKTVIGYLKNQVGGMCRN